MRHASFAPGTLAAMALLAGAPSQAGTSGASFAVGINLSQSAASSPPPVPGPAGAATPSSPPSGPLPPLPSGACYSTALSAQTGALVAVACASGQFVSIAPRPGAPFPGVHGGAFRYTISEASELSVLDAVALDAFGWRTGWGSVTMLRLYDLTRRDGPGDVWSDRPLEMLVTF